MRNILADLEKADQTEIVDSLIASFYRLKSAVDRDKLDEQKAKSLLGEFRESVGDDPIEAAIEEKQQRKARVAYKTSVRASPGFSTVSPRFDPAQLGRSPGEWYVVCAAAGYSGPPQSAISVLPRCGNP